MKRVIPSFVYLILIGFFMSQCSNRLSPQDAFEKGKLYLTKGHNVKKAYDYFKIAAEKDPENVAYQWAAAKTATERNLAFAHAKSAWDYGFKNYEVLLLLVSSSAGANTQPLRLNYALALYQQLPDSSKSIEVKADLFQRLDAFDSCLVIWKAEFAKLPTPILTNKIAFAYGKSGKVELAYSFMMDCRKKNLLNSNGYIMLMNLMALDYNYAGIDAMIAETKKNKLYNDTVQLEYAGYMIIQSKFDEAEGLLTELVRTLKFIKQDIMHQQTRVMLSFVYVSLNKKDKVEALFESVKNDSTIPTPEKEYYTAIINMLSDSAGSFAQLKAAQEKMPFYPVVNLLYARANIMKGDYKGAIAIYEKLPEVIGRSPRILVEFARALTKNDQYDEALGLLNIVHQRKLYTRNSLELFRDITFKKQLYEKSLEAQKVLETIFKDDTRLQYSSALLALKTGNKEKALKIITELKQKYPQEKQFEMTMFSMLLLKGEYQKVIDECKNSKIDQYLLTSYLAQAYLGLGDSVRAGQIYEKSIAYKKSLGLMIEYAQILSNGGSYSKSASIYKRILNDYKETVEKDTTRTHLFFNNYAWVLMHGTDTEKKEGLFYSRKAYNLKPGNIGILDTYGRCLIENGKYKDCIKLLKENKMIVKEPQLLYYLATAYEKTEDINNALRTYKDILACADSSKVLALEVSKNFLQTQIKRLSDAE